MIYSIYFSGGDFANVIQLKVRYSMKSVILLAILVSSCVGNFITPKKFDAGDSVCLAASGVLYTNVGTLILGPDGKPIPCVPPTSQTRG